MRDYFLVAVVAYLCGSIPFGFLLIRIFKGKDIRESGSGNIGATNVARTAPALGVVTLLLDAAKGFAPVWGASMLAVSTDAPAGRAQAMLALAALSVVVGHLFPVWLKFRGGKGVATAVGVYLALAPAALGLTLVVFLATLALSRYVSLASIISAIVIPGLACWQRAQLRQAPGRPLLAALIVVSALIILKHRANLRRLVAGSENRFGRSREKKAEFAAKDQATHG